MRTKLSPVRTAAVRLIFVLLAVAATTWFLARLQAYLMHVGSGHYVRPYDIAYVLPIVLVTAFLGWRAGVTSLVLSLFATAFLLMRPHRPGHILTVNDYTDLTFLTLIGGLIVAGLTIIQQNAVLQKERREALERERLALERERDASDRQRLVLREVLASVTDNRLRLCDNRADLPPSLKPVGGPIILSSIDVRTLREDARRAALESEFSQERCFDLMTAVSEAAMNAVVHAGGGEGRVSMEFKKTIQVRVQDLGSGIAMERLPQATLLRGHSTAGTLGHGFWLILNTVDRLWLLTGDTGTTIVLEQDRVPSDAAWLQASAA